jgi:prepilin-type N-terminal cleavage/methylation domain-containing protein
MKSYRNNSIHVVGFTLVEMLVVISILLLLIAIAIPSFTGVVLIVHVAQSQAIINQLDQAVQLYKADFNAVPPSTYTDSSNNNWYGCQSIVYYLTGYHTDPSDPTRTAYGLQATYVDSSGNTHYQRNSRVYGPYNSTETLKVTPGDSSGYTTTVKQMPNTVLLKDPNGNQYWAKDPKGGTFPVTQLNDVTGNAVKDSGGIVSHPTFLDAFGEVITYYSSNYTSSATTNAGQNAGLPFAYGGSGSGGYLRDGMCSDSVHNAGIDVNGKPVATEYDDGAYCNRQDHADVGSGHAEGGTHPDPTLQSTWNSVGSSDTPVFASPPQGYYTVPAGGGHGSTGGRGQADTTYVPYRTDYMLMSWGGDKHWYGVLNWDGQYGTIKDDATNLYGK